MKRLLGHKGHSIGSICLTVAATSCVGFLLVLGVAQALTAGRSPEDKPPDWVSGLNSPPAWSLHKATHFFPTPAEARRRLRGARGLAGRRCDPGPGGYCPTPPLLYMGGKGVQKKPTLYLILWGSNWNTTGVGVKLSKNLVKMLKGLSGSSYQGILTQYFDSAGRVGSTLKVTSYTDTGVTAPTSVGDAKIQEEVSSAITANKWTREFDSEFIVIPAPGSTYEAGFNTGFCGYHSITSVGASSYTFVAYMGDEPFKVCEAYDKGKKAENVTSMVVSHEYAESATDPDPSSATWITGDTGKLYEIGDICIKEDDEILGGLWVQGEWDNYQSLCSLSDPAPAFVYVVTEPASEITSATAKLNGVVNPESMATTYHFEYGTTTSYGTSAPVPDASAGSSRTNQLVGRTIKGLSANTTYHYVLVGSNSTGTAKAMDRTFTTSPASVSSLKGSLGVIKAFPEKTVITSAAEGPPVECKSASSEPAGKWAVQTDKEDPEGYQAQSESGPHLQLEFSKLGHCTGPTGLAAKVICNLQVVPEEGGSKEKATGGIYPPGCLLEIGPEANYCLVFFEANGNKGLHAAKLETSGKEVSLSEEIKGLTAITSENKELCKTLKITSGKGGEIKTSKPLVLEGLHLS